jgi:hypothetical protein
MTKSESRVELQIQFEGMSRAEANQAARSLADALGDAHADVEVTVAKDRQDTQDFGTTLVLALGTPAALAIAKGIADWLRRRPANTGDVVILEMGGGRVVARGKPASQLDVAATAKALAGK